MAFDPFKVKVFRDRGSADIDTRWTPPPGGAVIVSVRVHFTSGSGTAVLTCDSYNAPGGELLTRLFSTAVCGTGTDVFVRFAEAEINSGAWTIPPGEQLVFGWTNPAGGTMTWILEVRYQENA